MTEITFCHKISPVCIHLLNFFYLVASFNFCLWKQIWLRFYWNLLCLLFTLCMSMLTMTWACQGWWEISIEDKLPLALVSVLLDQLPFCMFMETEVAGENVHAECRQIHKAIKLYKRIKEEQHKIMGRYVLMWSLFLLPSVKPEMFRDENTMLESNMRWVMYWV